MAIRRGEAHAAGIHLLDTETGEYNRKYIRKYFPHGGVYLVRCVGRQQGLMLRKGNPLGIKRFADISKEGVRYVNRQKGSGTRILTDYLCQKEGVDSDRVYGYEREEVTHNAVSGSWEIIPLEGPLVMGSVSRRLGRRSSSGFMPAALLNIRSML